MEERAYKREKWARWREVYGENNWKQYEKSITAYKTLKRVSEDLLHGH